VQQIAKSTLGSIVLLAAISVVTIFFQLGSLPLSGNDEPRYARIAEEMYESGSWITPTLQEKPWLEKPPLYYWTTLPFNSLFQSKETAARFAPALCAFIASLAIFWLGRTLWGRLPGLIGASILLTSLGFIVGGRTAATDMPFTCSLTIGLSLLAAAVRKDPGALKILAAYAFLGLAVMGKGPVAVILATGTGLIYWYFNEHGNILSRWRIVRGLMILLFVSAPWFWLAFKENGYAFITTFFVNHNLARYITEIHHHSEPIYFYIPVLLLMLFPWSGWLPFLFNKSPLQQFRHRKDWDPGMLFLAGWFMFPILFFSLSDSKLAGYILPSLPPLALILGVRIAQQMEKRDGYPMLRIATILSMVFSTIMAAAAPVYFLKYNGGNWKVGLMLSIVFLVPAAISLFFGIRGHCGKAVATTLIQGLIVILTTVQFAGPVLGEYLSSRELAGQTLKSRLPEEPIVTYGITDHSLDYYTGYQVMGKVEDPSSLERLLQDHEHLLVVTEEHKIREFNFIEKYSITLLGEQGELRLLRLARK